MGILNRIGNLIYSKPKNRYEFTQEDSLTGVSIRKANQEIKQLRLERAKIMQEMEVEKLKAEMLDLKAQLYGEEETVEDADTPEKALTNMFLMAMLKGKGQGNGVSTTDIDISNSNKRKYSNEELVMLHKQVPKKELKKAKKLTTEQLSPLIRQQLPDADDDSINRAIALLRE